MKRRSIIRGILSFVVVLWTATGATFASTALDTIDDVRVDPLVKSKWDQMYAGGNPSGGDPCYNYYTPYQSYCGCGPTCFAQILRYHEWPKTAVGTNYFVIGFEDGLTKKVTTTNSYPCKYHGAVTNLTMVGGVYDWSKMPYETQKTGTPPAALEMIGRLCYDLGVSMCADYNKAVGTGMSSPAAVHALPGNFHYADASAVEWNLTTNMRTYDQRNLLRALIPSLDAKLPCALMIDGSGARHIIVCDGYGYHGGVLHLHLNVGYSGNWDGWYPVEGEWSWPINGLRYTSVAGIVYNISPHFNGPVVSGRIVDAAGNPVVGASVSVLRDGGSVTNVVSGVRGNYVFKVPPGDYAVVVEKGTLSRTEHLTLRPCISSAYMQNGDYYQTPVAVRIANRVDADILLDADAETVAAPTSIPADGSTFTGSQYVELYTQTEDAEIRYTLDGSIPDRESSLYTEPFEITAATTVRAIALKDGAYPSEIGAFRFIESTYGDVLDCPTTPWTSGGYATWFKDTDGVGGYNDTSDTKNRLRSGAFDYYQSVGKSSWLEATIDGPAKVSFDYRFYTEYYSEFNVVQDGTKTNVHLYVGKYTSEPNWTNGATIAVGAGVHRLRFDYYQKYRHSNAGHVHLRNMKIVYPNVLRCELPTYWDSEWSTATFTDGERSNIWSQLSPTNARVTVSGTSSARKLTVDANVTLRSLALNGIVRLAAESGKKLTVGSVNVSGEAQLLHDALEVSGAVTLATSASKLIVTNGIDLVPVSGVSGAKVVSAKASGYTTYSLEIGYVSPFSATPSGTANWSALTFTDRNNNQATWGALDAGTQSRVTLKASGAATVNVNGDVSLKSLMVTGSGSLTLKSTTSKALTVEATTVNADLEVASAFARLGAVTLAAGETLSVPSADAFTSVAGAGTLAVGGATWPTGKGLAESGWTGTLRLTGGLSGVCDLDALGHVGAQVVFAGTLVSGGEIRVTRELTVAGTANVQGTVVLTNLAARVVVKDGATINVASGVPYYEVASATEGDTTVYTLELGKFEHEGPFAAELDVEAIDFEDIDWRDANDSPGKWANLEARPDDEIVIDARRDIVIAMSGTEKFAAVTTQGPGHVTLLYADGKEVPAETKTALKKSSWTGTVKLAGSRTFSLTELGDYGNVGSTIELAGTITGSLAQNGRCDSALVLASGCLVTLDAAAGNTVYTFAGALSGTGEFYFSGTCSGRLHFIGDASAFRGCVNAINGRSVVYGDSGRATYADGYVIVNSEVTIACKGGWGNTWHAVQKGVNVNGMLTIESGVTIGPNMSSSVPVTLASPTARVLVKTGSGIVPVNGVTGETMIVETADEGKLYRFDCSPPADPDPDEPGPTPDAPPGWYVDVKTGDDANGGRSPADALKTINAALAKATSGEVVFVASGTYYEHLYNDVLTDIRVESLQGPDVTILDAGQEGGSVSCVADNSSSGMELTVVGFRLQHGSAYLGGGAYGGVYSNCEITACSAYYGGGVCDAILYDCRVHGNTASVSGGGVCQFSYACELYGTYVWDNWIGTGADKSLDNVDGNVGGDGPILHDPTATSPSIGEGDMVATISVNAGGEYVIAPTSAGSFITVNNAGDATIVIPPSVSGICGINPANLKVKQGAQDITGAFQPKDAGDGWYFLALDDDGSVTVDGEEIPVRPALSPIDGDGRVAETPFALGMNDVVLGVKSIPGLTYSLVRGDAPSGLANGTAVTNETATGSRVRLTDAEKPAGRAFYLIRVSTGEP